MKGAVITLTTSCAFLCATLFLCGCSDLLYISPEENVFDAFDLPIPAIEVEPLEKCKNEDQKGLAQIERCKGVEVSDETVPAATSPRKAN